MVDDPGDDGDEAVELGPQLLLVRRPDGAQEDLGVTEQRFQPAGPGNAGGRIGPAAQDAKDSGMAVITWDTPIPSAEGEDLFIAQVDFNEIGVVMADMALSILDEEGGQFAILSSTPDATNQNVWIAAFVEALTDEKMFTLSARSLTRTYTVCGPGGTRKSPCVPRPISEKPPNSGSPAASKTS